ncbi:hypothetical protein Acsp06_62920 [Actinomycetospora sp. NBRC 106375]|nr:hypothetical protein Acsp06_62920 [Actinomycetospora sp. NBRC 106375]
MSSTNFRFASDVRREKRFRTVKVVAVIGLTAVGAWRAALVVSALPAWEASEHPGGDSGDGR